MTYPGGKNGAGVYQQIINLMPPHDTYVEPFLGGGAILRLKRPAKINIGIDSDHEVIRAWHWAAYRGRLDRTSPETARVDRLSPDLTVSAERAGNGDAHRRASLKLSMPPIAGAGSPELPMVDRRQYLDLASLKLPMGPGQWQFPHRDALEFLREWKPGPRDLVYCDPPYLHSTRGRPDLYAHEMTDAQHRELLGILLKLPCMVMVSGYWSQMYARKLRGWNSTTFQAMTRGGRPATEWLWFNFPEPVALHDYSYLGSNFRERERIKRKKLRWVNRLKRMPALEKRALLSAIEMVS